jgi:hypothetical protein
MSCIFTSSLFPHQDSKEVFGIVQKSYSPSNIVEGSFKKLKCSKCGASLFPTKTEEFKCPICDPDFDYIEGSVKAGEGFDVPSIYFFVFDISFQLETIKKALEDLMDYVEPESKICVICASYNESIVIYQLNGLPIFDNYASFDAFISVEECFTKPVDVKNIIIPSLDALYNVTHNIMKDDTQLDVTTPIQICRRQVPEKSEELFSIIFFVSREVKPLSAERAFALSKVIATSGGIVHFAAKQSFKRLAAIARETFGIVIGMSDYVGTTMKKFVLLSRPQKIKFIFPRFIETTKVTGADGNVRLTTLLSIVKLTSGRGISMKLSVDFQRINNDVYGNNIRFIEQTTTSEGRFYTLHTFKPAKSVEEYTASVLSDVSNALACKGVAADALRPIFAGEDFFKIINKLEKQNQSFDLLAETDIVGIGTKADRDTQRLYYVLHRIFNQHKHGEFEEGKFKFFVAPPSVYVYSQDGEDAAKAVEERFVSEWPYELHIFKDEAALKLLITNFAKL